MRRAVLLRSISRVLGAGTVVRDGAYMWARHRWMVPYGATAFGAVAFFAPIGGIDDWPTRIAVGAAAAAVAITATTEYRVLAQTDDGVILLKASKIRQVATEVQEELPADATMEPVGGTVLAADWQVGAHRYTVPRSSEQAMNRIAAAQQADS
ncbi:MAG: hypothetical protein U9N84_08170 [Actinomycetota bacterium]|nr:hypothetical protein [Actinomycetota bacterium]